MVTGGAARLDRPRRVVAAVLAATFIVLAPVAVASAWIRGTVLSTSGYVAAVRDLPASPAVRAVIGEAVTAEVSVRLPRADALAGPLRTRLADLAGQEASAFTASPAFERLWVAANQSAHAQLISVLNGNGGPAGGGQVTLRLAQVSAGLQVPLFPVSALARPRLAYRILTGTTWLALALTPLAFAGALAASPRRRTLLTMLAGGTVTLLLAGTTLSWLQARLIARADPRYQPLASAVVHALTSGFFTLTAWCGAAGLIVIALALLTGPYRWAAVTRRYLRLTAVWRRG